jgi:uncharacterized protein YkwD
MDFVIRNLRSPISNPRSADPGRQTVVARLVTASTLAAALAVACAFGHGRSAGAGLAQSAAAPTAQRPGDGFDAKAACAEVVAAHNRIRAEEKLPKLTVSNKLQAAAQRHARDMVAQGKMTHTGSDDSAPADRIEAAGYRYRRCGENVAAGRFSVERLMTGWMNSPTHKENILGSFSQIGAACAIAEDGKRYWCVTFGLPARR